MGNMHYCMFENTFKDLQDCYEELGFENGLSESETKYRNKLIKLCKEIAADYEDF